jgi:hypothetical protein
MKSEVVSSKTVTEDFPRRAAELLEYIENGMTYGLGAISLATIKMALQKCIADETTTPHLLDQFTAALTADPDLAWSWHCNIAMPIMDRMHCSHTAANEAAVDLMRHLFHIDIKSNSCWAITVRPEEPTPPRIKPGDRVRNSETGSAGVVMTIGSERAQVQYDDGRIREPPLRVLLPEKASGEYQTYPGEPITGIYEAGVAIVRLGKDDEATGE